jgi:hypothetical protein
LHPKYKAPEYVTGELISFVRFVVILCLVSADIARFVFSFRHKKSGTEPLDSVGLSRRCGGSSCHLGYSGSGRKIHWRSDARKIQRVSWYDISSYSCNCITIFFSEMLPNLEQSLDAAWRALPESPKGIVDHIVSQPRILDHELAYEFYCFRAMSSRSPVHCTYPAKDDLFLVAMTAPFCSFMLLTLSCDNFLISKRFKNHRVSAKSSWINLSAII